MSVNPSNLCHLSDSCFPSHYAVKVALQTMKERCHKLQSRLSLLEEENLQLRIERHKLPLSSKGVSSELKAENPCLLKQVEELGKHKSQLSHHVYMVANENRALWERLSKIPSNGPSINQPSSGGKTISKESASCKPLKSLALAETWSNKCAPEESLEEISLKVLNSIMKNKISSDEDSMEMKEVNLEDSLKDCEFRLVSDEDYMDDDDYVMCEVKELSDTVKMQKEILKEQQESLKKSFEIISNVLESGVPCKKCKSSKDPEPKTLEEVITTPDKREVPNVEPPVITNGFITPTRGKYEFEDRICPICAKFYTKSTPFNEFNDHVVSHFIHEGDDESDSLISTNGMIT